MEWETKSTLDLANLASKLDRILNESPRSKTAKNFDFQLQQVGEGPYTKAKASWLLMFLKRARTL